MKPFFKFFISRKFFINLILILVLISSLIGITIWGLNIYTRHGKEYKIPNLKGVTLKEARQKLRELHLRDTIIDSIFTNEVPKGCIVETNPEEGFKVKRNRRIFLTINSFSDEIIDMPGVVGASLENAKAELEIYGLKIGRIKYKTGDYRNYVVEQSHKGKKINIGEKIKKGAYIDLLLERGKDDEEIETPSLYGLKLDVAHKKAIDHYLNIGEIKYDETVKNKADSINAFVYKQQPFTNNKIYTLGKNINIELTVNKIKAMRAKQKEKIIADSIQNAAKNENTEQQDSL